MVGKILKVLYLDHIYMISEKTFEKRTFNCSYHNWRDQMWRESELKTNTEVIRSHGGDEREYGSLSCVPSTTQLCTFSTPFAAPSPILLSGSSTIQHDVIGRDPFQYTVSIIVHVSYYHCEDLLNVLDDYLTSEVSWRRPVMSLLAISPFLPILSIPCFSHCFAALRLLSLLDIKWKKFNAIWYNIQYMFRFGWGAQFVLTFHLTSSLPISVFTRRLLQVRIIGCLTFGCSSAFIIGSRSLPIVAKVLRSVTQILDLLKQSIDWPTIKYYWNYLNNWLTTSYSLLEQICSGADERQSRWHSLEWSPLILCLQSSAATSIDRCVQHRALRVMCVVLCSTSICSLL